MCCMMSLSAGLPIVLTSWIKCARGCGYRQGLYSVHILLAIRVITAPQVYQECSLLAFVCVRVLTKAYQILMGREREVRKKEDRSIPSISI